MHCCEKKETFKADINVTRPPESNAPKLQNEWNLDIIRILKSFSICAAKAFIETSAPAHVIPDIKRTPARIKNVSAMGINTNRLTKIEPKYKQDFLFPIFWIICGAIKKPMRTPNGCMNKAMDRSMRLKPSEAFTSGIRKSHRDNPSDWVTKNNRKAIMGLSWSLDLNNKTIFQLKVIHREFLTPKLNVYL